MHINSRRGSTTNMEAAAGIWRAIARRRRWGAVRQQKSTRNAAPAMGFASSGGLQAHPVRRERNGVLARRWGRMINAWGVWPARTRRWFLLHLTNRARSNRAALFAAVASNHGHGWTSRAGGRTWRRARMVSRPPFVFQLLGFAQGRKRDHSLRHPPQRDRKFFPGPRPSTAKNSTRHNFLGGEVNRLRAGEPGAVDRPRRAFPGITRGLSDHRPKLPHRDGQLPWRISAL